MSEPLEAIPAVQQGEGRRGIFKELTQRGRIIFFAVVFAVELALFFGATAVPIDQTQQQALVNQANSILGSSGEQGPWGIFVAILTNNLRVALFEMIPLAGAALFLASIFTTGQVIQALAISSNIPGPVFGLLLFFFPFSLVELSAYALAVASGSMLLVAWRRKRLKAEVRVFMFEAAVVIVTLVIAAAMETAGIVAPVVGFALWLPTALGMLAIVMLVRGAWR